MMRPLLANSRLCRRLLLPPRPPPNLPSTRIPFQRGASVAIDHPFSSAASSSESSDDVRREDRSPPGRFGVPEEDLPYFHHTKREKPKPKFKSPRKRASKLFDEINKEAVIKNQKAKPSVHDAYFRPGDAIECTMVVQGGTNSKELEKVRGVVLGRVNRGLGSGFYLRDVMFGEPIDRKIPLHSPMLKSVKVLEKNFVFKGKRKVKRAKLYYLRDRNPIETRVTKW